MLPALSRADAVFLGRLVSREVSGGSVSSDPALHVLAVTEVYKGSAHAEQGVVSAASGGSRGLELTGEGPLAVSPPGRSTWPGTSTGPTSAAGTALGGGLREEVATLADPQPPTGRHRRPADGTVPG
jgi:hypothetical protein